MRRLLPLFVLLNACDSTGPSLPPGAMRFVPPAVYQEWWALTEQCSGTTADSSAVTWYRLPRGAGIPLGDGTFVNGRWDAVENRIILDGESEFAGDLVRHEMLHALLRAGGHPRAMFIGRCGGVVVCTKACISDGGPPPQSDPNAQRISPSELEVSVEVTPVAPNGSTNSGTLMMIVTARNPKAVPVVVQLPPSGDSGPSVDFRYRLDGYLGGTSYDMRAESAEATEFSPLESKRFIFDFHIGAGDTRYDLAPATYQFNGAYSTNWAASPPTVLVSP